MYSSCVSNSTFKQIRKLSFINYSDIRLSSKFLTCKIFSNTLKNVLTYILISIYNILQTLNDLLSKPKLRPNPHSQPKHELNNSPYP